jgi:hypothetical protein
LNFLHVKTEFAVTGSATVAKAMWREVQVCQTHVRKRLLELSAEMISVESEEPSSLGGGVRLPSTNSDVLTE